MVFIRPTFAAAVVLVFVGALMTFPAGSAQSGAPANCSAANLNNWWGYQYNQQVRSTWDSYSSQSRGVCVMREAGLPIPGECKFTVQSPWWVASGTPASPPLCWWGTPTTPAVTVSAPAACLATSLSARAAYADPTTKALWDYYSAQTVGVCESIGAVPSNCRFMVQESQGGQSKHLCWWPAQGGTGLKQVLDRSAYERLSAAALGVPEICDLVGSGKSVIEFRVGSERVQVQIKDCKVVDIQWLTPPDGCRDIEPSRYASIVGQADIDAGLANAADACLLPRAPTKGECASSIAVAASSYLCFYGKRTGGTKAAVAAFTGSAKFFIEGDKSAIRAILNSADATETTRELVCDGNIVMNAEAPADKIKLRVAQSEFLEGRICKGKGSGLDYSYGGLDYTAGIQYPGDLATAVSPDGSLVVFNKDGAALGFLPGSLVPAGDDPLLGDPMPDTLGGEWRDQVLSQPPSVIESSTPRGGILVVGSPEVGGMAVFASMLSGQDPEDIAGWWFSGDDARNPGLQWTGTVLQPLAPRESAEQWIIGPAGLLGAPDDGPTESILDDITECKVICSATRSSGVFGPGGAYLGGGVAGLEARNNLVGAGLVGLT